MTEQVDALVVGAGVVGLACARRLARAGREVLVAERADLIGSETSSRNSEVIHAGIYYPEGSLKARWCVAGKAMLYAFCEAYGVPHRRCGKIIVATSESQLEVLEGYRQRARANSVGELPWLSVDEVREMEPAVRCVGAVHSPTTGIIDSHAYMLALQGDLEAHGGMVAFGTEVQTLQPADGGVRVVTTDFELQAAEVVNAAGLFAPYLASRSGQPAPAAAFARGRYYGYAGRPPFSRLVYPVAEAGGLGVHVTVDLGGQVRFGPDVEWVDAVDYTFDDSRRAEFAHAIARYFPDVQIDQLQPGYTGIRPKISGRGETAADFRLDGPAEHGVRGLVNLLGIESPGLTASLAIADAVADVLGGD